MRIRRSDFDAFIASVEPEREPVGADLQDGQLSNLEVEPTPSIWDGEIPMPVSPR